ncbi:PAC2 family protein [Blastopirellula sp. JC732]|uniref:PAC2 family protein n=1 Tax=Blastopirellula sediminis TaxID=2894196 RepID=A0A9X1MKY6_9BACT|nr:PAC2 family protein [Blastopirellula sediminis]MCC9608330.1 PAC2 family protein [Blastopirellula sediminis]MCC9628893.1 PAC2 family protein [Blastopirellula sediminis]
MLADDLQLHRPWLVAVWPGMGNVGVNAGIYLLSKLEMTLAAEFEVGDLFDVDQVEVTSGIIHIGRRPRHRLFLWQDPAKKRDLLVFLGEAQPPAGKFNFCRQLIRNARQFGVERIFTFAAMATGMRPKHGSHVFVAATDEALLHELEHHEMVVLENGNIGGLNGILLGAAAEAGLQGACLLGEMPQVFAQLPYPKASLEILRAFSKLTDIQLDLSELAEQGRAMEEQLQEILAKVEGDQETEEQEEEEEGFASEAPEPEGPDPELAARIEQLFAAAANDSSKAFELKQELDRLGLFFKYEDRFLDLFKKKE